MPKLGRRKHGRSDRTQEEIVKALRDIGASVTVLSSVGGGCPDLLVGFRGRTFAIEVKAGGGRLTDAQRDWWWWFNGAGSVVETVEEAFKVIGAING